MGMVALEKVETPEDVEALHGFIQQHQEHTGSTTAQKLLDDFGTEVTKFVKVRGLAPLANMRFQICRERGHVHACLTRHT